MKNVKHEIEYIDRNSKKKCIEQVYGQKALQFLYGDDLMTKVLGAPLLHLFVKYPIFSKIYGAFQKSKWSRKKIVPFIEKFNIDSNEFLEPITNYKSFNDFFIRKLKKQARPIADDKDVAIIPADGRYLFYENIDKTDGFIVKDKKFNLKTLLNDLELANQYKEGTLILARLCPTDYHRFHFPVDGYVGDTRLINGWLYSVNPIALKKNIEIFTENKRTVTEIESPEFGKVLFLEIGATAVGTIVETYKPNTFYQKGDEKGFFSFGGSSLVVLFEKGRLKIDEDLLLATKEGLEIKCLMGERLGCKNKFA